MNENQNIIREAKKLSLPKGKNVEIYSDSYEWVKHGGYAHTAFRRVELKLTENGYSQVQSNSSHSPDGEVVVGGNHWVNGPFTLTVHKSYGCTQHDNWYRIKLKLDNRCQL